MKLTLQLFLLILCGALSLGSHAQSAPEVLYLQTVPSVSGCAGSEANDVVTIWSNSPQNLTVTRTFYTSADCGGEPSSATTFEITPLGISTPVRLKITLPLGMKSCKFNVVSQSNLSTSACLPLTVNPVPSRLYVNASASGANTGLTWADAFTDLQSALSYPCSSNLTEIWVAGGTYKPTADASGNTSPANPRTKTFVMVNGVAIYGGFNGTETQLTARNWRNNPTILSGNIGDTGIDTDNSYRVINNNFTSGSPLGNTAILDGFIVEKGYANGGFPFNLGGGMWNAYASPKVQNCVFRNNYATSGGGMFNDNSSSSITNCLFLNNTVTTAGAGISNGGGTDMVKVINCTFYGNAGPTTIINERSATSISNSIVWGNGGGISGGTVTYSNVQGGVSGTGNVNSDPRFENAVGGDFRLQQCSPAIDAGTNTNAPASDFAGNARPFNATGVNNTDMGAYEYQSSYSVCNCIGNNGIVYVNASASGNNSGRSWADAYTDLQSALNGARNFPSCVSQIWVAAGTYKPTADASGNTSPADARMKSFVMVNGVAIYGGFNGTETQLTARNWRSNPTILSGNIGDTGIDTDNSYRVINNNFTSGSPLGNTAILDGFIVEKGYANGGFPLSLGAGMWNSNASPNIQNCVFRNNYAVSGGGMFNDNSSSSITNCLFLNNTATTAGAGISNGGATDMVRVVNCTFYGNVGTTTINNQRSATSISNSIIWGNGGGVSGGTITYSNVQGGSGNISSDPLFVNAAGGDFRLQQCSPAIDAGTNTNAPTTDFEGNARPFNATGVSNADIGAFEYQSSYDVCTACTNITGEVFTVSSPGHSRTVTVGYWRACGLYKVRITAKGAKGGNNGGAGAIMIGDFIVSSSQVLESVAGAPGGDGNRGGGGGGSGTRIQGGVPLIIAGGGGGNSGGGSGLITTGNGQGGNWLVTGGGGGGGLNGSGFGGAMGGGAGFNALGGIATGNGGGGYGGGGGGTGLHAGGGGGQTGGTAITPSNGGASYNLGSNQNNTAGANNAGGQVIIEYLGAASLSATVTPTSQCTLPGSLSIDLTGDLNGNTSGGVEYAIVAGNSFTGTPTFADITADPFNLTSGTGTTEGTYTVRVRLKYNPTLYVDNTYSLLSPTTITPTIGTATPTTCGGSEGSITLSGFLNNTVYSVTYKKNSVAVSAANFTSNGSGVITLTGLGAGNYTEIVATYGGCVSNAATATLEDPAPPTATIASNNSPICSGNTATFSVSGTTGATLTYTLTGLAGNQTLLLDGTTQTITANNATTDVMLTLVSVTKNNCLVSLTATSTVTVNPLPTATIANNNSPICSGNNATFSVSGTTGATLTYTLTGLTGNQTLLLDGTTQTILATNATADATLTLASVTKNNCLVSLTATSTVTVNPLPTATIANNNSPICSGSNATFSVSGTTGATLTYTLTGLTGNQTLLLDGTTQTITAPNATVDVTLTLVSVTKNNCLVSLNATSTVTVNPSPTATIASNNSPICSGNNATFSVSGTTGATLTYTLTGLTGNQTLLLDGTTQTITANNATTDVMLTLVSVTKNNCLVSLTATSTVTVNPLPTATIGSNNSPICLGNTATFSVSGTTGATLTYTLTGLTGNQTLLLDGTTQTITANNATADVTLTLVSVTKNSCLVSLTATSTVAVNPLPTATIANNNSPICAGNNATFSVSGTTGATLTYTLTGLAGNQTLLLDGTTQTISANNATADVTLTLVNVTKNNCLVSLNATSTVTVNPSPTATIASNNSPICAGNNATFSVSGTTGATLTYTLTGLTGNQTLLLDGTTQTITATNATADVTFTLVSVTKNNCLVSLNATSTVTVNPLPTATVANNNSPICAGNNATFSVNGTTGATLTYTLTGLTGNQTLLLDGTTQTITAPNATADVTLTLVNVTKNNCLVSLNATSTVTVNPSPTATIAGTTTVCKNATSPKITFTGAGGTTPYTFTYKINNGSEQTIVTTSSSSVSLEAPTGQVGIVEYSLVSVKDGSSTLCSRVQTGSATVTVQGKPTITLTTLQQTLNEGNSQTFCDTDANPINGLQFTVSGSCVLGSPVWRVQVGSNGWSAWSPNAPVSQPSNNQPYRYQAACDASCAVTYTNPIELTINYRSTVPQNVTMLVDGVTVAVGETKEVCSLVNIPLSFNANCGANEVTLYSVDGGEYSAGLPVGLVDNQYHNYRVRCRQSGGTVSCVESESGVMRLKLVVIPSAPTVSLLSTGSCNSGSSFSGQSSCGSLRTVWYNASTNVALPSLPASLPLETISYYARCQTENGCVSEKSNVVTFTVTPTHVAPTITVSQDIVCTGTRVRISANCPAGSQTFWNTGVTASSFEVAFSNVTKQTYWAKCLFDGGCQSAESIRKDVYWNAFVVTLINIGESKSAVKVNDRSAWTSQFITRDGGPELEQSTQVNPTLYYVENANKMAPRYWTINVEACGLNTDGSLTFDMLATPEMGVIRSFNTHENNAPYFMYANREGWTELYAQNHPAYGFYQDNGAGGNSYDAGLPKGLYKLGIRYWDQKGWGSIYPSTRKPQGNVLAYQEYWFRIQSRDGVGVGAAREGANGSGQEAKSKGQGANGQGSDNGKQITDNGAFANVMPNPVTHTLRLKVQDSKGQTVQTALTDVSGREVLSRQFIPETNTHQEEFGVSALPTGMYFLKVTTANQQATLKVVKVE
ncbi:hypothetical protein FHS57_002363 [Runella defluvii]|uniref:Secretion system C-terminal sorting domain-containing protein n=1 Tax=Runella defluvii TaxID=370973 RepID=A0A7W5ZK52_9BACT|nr:choice-of-anchor Q domain-containing protein [Runella defluvii]MBB3838358.1 hypothetical protein [Runella defluvii]